MNARLIHGICTYRYQWLPGDERGWRSKGHKRHSSGDYKNPPPPQEHEGLRRFVKSQVTGKPVQLQPPEYPVLGSAFVHKLHKSAIRMRCFSCGPTHIHVLYESEAQDVKPELAGAKQYASLKLKSRPGRVFARDESVDEIKSDGHARRLWNYILDHAYKEGAWVWRYDRDAIPTRDDIKRLTQECARAHVDSS